MAICGRSTAELPYFLKKWLTRVRKFRRHSSRFLQHSLTNINHGTGASALQSRFAVRVESVQVQQIPEFVAELWLCRHNVRTWNGQI